MALTGYEYIQLPVTELGTHVDYSTQAMVAVLTVINMTTEELEGLYSFLKDAGHG